MRRGIIDRIFSFRHALEEVHRECLCLEDCHPDSIPEPLAECLGASLRGCQGECRQDFPVEILQPSHRDALWEGYSMGLSRAVDRLSLRSNHPHPERRCLRSRRHREAFRKCLKR